MRHKVEQRGAVRAEEMPKIVVDSCGTGGGSSNWYKSGGFSYHEGETPDSRMTAAAATRGIKLRGASRPLVPGDFSRFKYIVCMDNSNRDAVIRALAFWRGAALGLGTRSVARDVVRARVRNRLAKANTNRMDMPRVGF